MKQVFYSLNEIKQSAVKLDNDNAYRVMSNFEGSTVIARLATYADRVGDMANNDAADVAAIFAALGAGQLELVGDRRSAY